MKFTSRIALLLGIAVLFHASAFAETRQRLTKIPPTPAGDLLSSYDVIVSGAGTGGTMAAVQAARLGASVLLVEETDWIGGQMTAAAVSSLDEGTENAGWGVNRENVRERGLYREFCDRVFRHYASLGISPDTCYITEDHLAVEPSVGQAIFYQMIDDTRRTSPTVRLDLSLETSVTAVRREGNRVTGVELSINTPAGPVARTVASRILIDATEYGDLLPLAGARYRVGNWISSDDHSGATTFPLVQDYTWTAVIRGWPDGAPSGHAVAEAPPGYRAADFADALNNPRPTPSTKPWSWQRFVAYRGMPDSTNPDRSIRNPWPAVTRTHVNVHANDGHVTVEHIENPDARRRLDYELKLATLKLIHYFQNDMDEPVTTWTVARDEGFNTPYNRAQNARLVAEHPELAPFQEILNHFPVMPYVRESRRMVGMATLRARDIDRRTGPTVFPTSIAVGDYAVDLHGANSPDALEADLDQPEDLKAIGFQRHQVGPFTVPYEVLVPETLDGFLAAEKNFSQSRLVNGATRLQPSTMLIGQAAGAAAALAVREGLQPRQLRPIDVQKTLLDAGDILYAARFDLQKFPGVDLGSPLWKSLQLGLLYGFFEPGDSNLIPGGWELIAGELGDGGWYPGDDGDYTYKGDGIGIAAYTGRFLDGSSAAAAGDYVVRTRFLRPSGTGIVGVVGRLQNGWNYYEARIAGDRLELVKRVDNVTTRIGESVSAGYRNGEFWTLELGFQGTSITAQLYDRESRPAASVAATDTSLSSGSAGLIARPGRAGVVFEEFTLLDSQNNPQYATGFPPPLRIATDPLTRGRMAIHLTRYFNLPTTGTSLIPTYADVPTTHPAFRAVEALSAAGITTPAAGAPASHYLPEKVVPRAELVSFVARALNLPPSRLSTAGFLPDGFLASPDAPVRIADLAQILAEMLAKRPTVAGTLRVPSTKP